jgi:hypothetical protein
MDRTRPSRSPAKGWVKSMKYQEALTAMRAGRSPLSDWELTVKDCLKYRIILNLIVRNATKET